MLLLPDSCDVDKAVLDIDPLLLMGNMNTGRSPVDDIHILGGGVDNVHILWGGVDDVRILGGGNLGRVDGIVRRSLSQKYFVDREEGNNSNNCTDSDSGSASILGFDNVYDMYNPRPPPPDVEVDNRDVALQRVSLHDAAYELLPPPLPPAHPTVRSRMRTAARLAAQMTDFWYEICRPCLRSRLVTKLMPRPPIPMIL